MAAQRTRDIAGIAPIILAAGLALLYTVGAVQTMAGLHAEDAAALQGIPLVPLPQMLGRGIAVIASAGLTFLLLALSLLFSLWTLRSLGHRRSSRTPETDRRQRFQRRQRALVFGFGFNILIGLLIAPWRAVIAMSVGVVMIGLIVLAQPEGRGRVSRLDLLGSVATLIVMLGIQVSLTPDPFPTAHLTTRNGGHPSGALLAITDSQWLLVRDGRIESFRLEDVRRSYTTKERSDAGGCLIGALCIATSG